MKVNEILPFDSNLLDVSINLRQLETIAKEISSRGQVSRLNEVIWAIKALTLTDLTTLSGDDTKSNVSRLCVRSAYPLPLHILDKLEPALTNNLHTGAVCVYPSRVADAYETFTQLKKESKIPIAAVATGFPTGQYSLESRLKEIDFAIKSGAAEIDIVINRQLALCQEWQGVYEEICAMRTACGDKARLKTILAIGELGTMENVYKASMVAMMAGADFIKTSTGKEAVNATIPVGLVMINAIQEFQRKTGQIVGLKPAGGVRTVREAITWMTLVKETLGMKWLQPELFRFGASGLLDDIEKVVRKGLTGIELSNVPVAAY
ncbi:deoxyribose-phosphate aldolase [Episyrphus balteatus]|uniref:deoxyribose-phosphate aldolase n=1 Tax=Episyrphus balteatus TaxID=286459 RepID=UPI002485E09D|nr:deoxyribose-phosphate aldolase [Episyrphus balteatus]